ncbi:acid-resistance protein, partial [Escherichia coli]|nr:acid-resistance protein [Escherichia coli]
IAGLFGVAGVISLMSWYRQRSMKGGWLQLVIGVLDIVIDWIFLGATPMVSVTLVSTRVGIELIFHAASLFSIASLFVKQP